MQTIPRRIRHNHTTRDIKPLGQCPACDRYRATTPEPKRALRWSITTDADWLFLRWECLACESGTGSAPTWDGANTAAAIHYAAAHGGAL